MPTVVTSGRPQRVRNPPGWIARDRNALASMEEAAASATEALASEASASEASGADSASDQLSGSEPEEDWSEPLLPASKKKKSTKTEQGKGKAAKSKASAASKKKSKSSAASKKKQKAPPRNPAKARKGKRGKIPDAAKKSAATETAALMRKSPPELEYRGTSSAAVHRRYRQQHRQSWHRE